MEVIRSRQNALIKRFVALASDGKARQEAGEFVCAGEKLLREAISSGAEIGLVLTAQPLAEQLPYRLVEAQLLHDISPLKNSPGPVFTVKWKPSPPPEQPRRAVVLEDVQDPGNVGGVLRTADALGIDLVVLCGACADPWQPKSVRASMGAIFRQRIVRTEVEGLPAALGGLALYGAALSPGAADIRAMPQGGVAVAIGNEGRGLTSALLARCAGTVVIPMRPWAESLNAGVAAAIAMWEMVRVCPN